ncbi:MAG TPA: fused MFS/spermidine synthase [Acidimicrobiales bacterium]|nr:fused MFS/spermidine synthase [Acidimicrobiales bacterium]
MRSWVASGLVFVTSGAVLVLEILAARLLAPYVGVTLETYTAIIATVLAGIAGGTYVGGRAADGYDPSRLLGPLLAVGGVLSVLTVPLVRMLGPGAPKGGSGVLVVTALTFLAPAAVLSAVSPVVVKLLLRDLGRTGEIVGRLSAVGTAGAIVGTLLAGFVLVEVAATSTSIYAIGGALAVGGVILSITRSGLAGRAAAVLLVVTVAAVGLGSAAGDPCTAETTYHCAQIVDDPVRPAGRALVLDTLRHSYVDLDDPTHLEFRYIREFAAAVDALAPPGELTTVHVGGGALTMARWLAATRPGSSSAVLEIDAGLVDVVIDEFGPPPAGTSIRIGDGRTLLRDVASSSVDVVFGDAFGGLAVPWHLTTEEAVSDIARVLSDDGIYAVNVIDYPPLRFARAEAATLQAVFASVLVVTPPPTLAGVEGGNVVLVASKRPLDAARLSTILSANGDGDAVIDGADVTAFVGDAPVLVDDHAPVDQWLARSTRRD